MLNKELVLQSNAKSSIVYGHVVTFGHGDSVWNPDGDPYWLFDPKSPSRGLEISYDGTDTRAFFTEPEPDETPQKLLIRNMLNGLAVELEWVYSREADPVPTDTLGLSDYLYERVPLMFTPQTETVTSNYQGHLMEDSIDAQQGITDDGWREFRCYSCSENSARKRRRKLSDYARSVLRSTLYKFSVASTNLSLRDCRVHDKSTKRNGPRYYWWQLRFLRCRSYTNRCNNKTQLHGEVQSIGQLRSTELRIYVLAPQEALYA